MRKVILCSVLALVFSIHSIAQTNATSVFEAAVDQINCETIRFIHREVDRADVANNMECLSFESIMKSIPEDETNTTGKLAKDINNIKSRYKADQEIGAQLDAAIAVAVKKIESRQRKQNIPDFKKKLDDIKSEAMKNAAALATGTAPDDESAGTNAEAATETAEDGTTAEDGSINILADEETGDTVSAGGANWLGWLSLIISLLALSLAGYSFLRKGSKSAPRSAPTAPVVDGNRQRDDALAASTVSAAAIKELEAKMYQELKRVQDQFDEKIAAVTASTGYTEPESIEEQLESTMDETGVPSLSDAMVETMDLPVDIEEREDLEEPMEKFHEPAMKTKDMQEPPLFSIEEKGMEPMETTLDESFDEQDEEKEREQFEITADEIAAMPDPPHTPVPGPGSFSAPSAESTPAEKPSESMLAYADEEDEEGLPFYRYISMPDADGSFPDGRLTESAGSDAVYEVEMYEDVLNKAFFSPLPYPEVVAKVLADPQKYLAPCCTYSDDPAGKQHIIVVEEGTLRKQGDRWYVHDKAKLRFA